MLLTRVQLDGWLLSAVQRHPGCCSTALTCQYVGASQEQDEVGVWEGCEGLLQRSAHYLEILGIAGA